MKTYTIELTNNICEFAIGSIALPNNQKPWDYLGKLKETWMEQEDPAWFERDDICHCSGAIFDAKLKIKVMTDGKKIDAFKAIDLSNLFTVTEAFKTNPKNPDPRNPETAHVMGMANSIGVATFEIDMEEYDRNLIQFNVSKFSINTMPYSEAYIVKELVNGKSLGYDSQGINERVFTEYLPSSAAPNKEFNLKYSSVFRKECL
jgi:hypothetical protein